MSIEKLSDIPVAEYDYLEENDQKELLELFYRQICDLNSTVNQLIDENNQLKQNLEEVQSAFRNC